MKSDPAEYKEIVRKLLEKTRQRKVEWEQYGPGFRCSLGASSVDSLDFTVWSDTSRDLQIETFTLKMSDQHRNTIFEASSNDLPTSPAEEEVSQMIEGIYNLARRQALKIELKLEQASALLDQV